MKHQEDWIRGEITHEIDRCEAILRDPKATDEDRRVAAAQIANYRELSFKTGNVERDIQ